MSAKSRKSKRTRSSRHREVGTPGEHESYYYQPAANEKRSHHDVEGQGFFPGYARKRYRTKPQDWYRDWHRDLQIIFVIAMCVLTFTICAYIFNAFMDFMTPLVNILGITEGPAAGGGLLTFRNTANAVLALVVSLMVGGGLVVLLFRQSEVNDSPYVDGE